LCTDLPLWWVSTIATTQLCHLLASVVGANTCEATDAFHCAPRLKLIFSLLFITHLSSASSAPAAAAPVARAAPESVWTERSLDGDADGARKAKFLKLMGASKNKPATSSTGIGSGGPVAPASAATAVSPPPGAQPGGSATQLLGNLERQFEEGRMHTYVGRRAGLGRYTLEPTGGHGPGAP
jgi:hypothetical protein